VGNPQVDRRVCAGNDDRHGLRLGVDEPDRVQMVGETFSFSLIDDEPPLTEHVHLAFSAQDDATVRAFHAAGASGHARLHSS
jgi:hypothetical protein